MHTDGGARLSLYRGAVTLEDQIVLDRLLDDAFAPARARTVPLSAARVRARIAWERQAPVAPAWRAVARLGRLGETSLAIGLTAIVFAGSLGGVAAQTEHVQSERGSEFVVRVSAPLDESRFLRALRLGHTASASDVLDATRPLPVSEVDPVDAEPGRTLRESPGPLR